MPSASIASCDRDSRLLSNAMWYPAAYCPNELLFHSRCVLAGRRYDFVLELKHKESLFVDLEYFQVGEILGQGSFGLVFEMTKRDCGKRYASKVMGKPVLAERFGDGWWEVIVQTERNILAALNHPLLINLAYTFQNKDYIVLVMDLCESGDLTPFGATGKETLYFDQIRFIGIEVLLAANAHIPTSV
jgi:serine/threonine protein kinase